MRASADQPAGSRLVGTAFTSTCLHPLPARTLPPIQIDAGKHSSDGTSSSSDGTSTSALDPASIVRWSRADSRALDPASIVRWPRADSQAVLLVTAPPPLLPVMVLPLSSWAVCREWTRISQLIQMQLTTLREPSSSGPCSGNWKIRCSLPSQLN